MSLVGGGILFNGSSNVNVVNTVYADDVSTVTSATFPMVGITVNLSSSNIYISGFSFAYGSDTCQPNSSLFSITASSGVVIENVGSYSNRLSLNTTNGTVSVLNLFGSARNIKMRRVYVSNTRGAPFDVYNSATDVLIENVFADFADVGAIPVNNCVFKGVGFTSSNAGQTAVYGNHWKDRFTSTVDGVLEITANEPSAKTAAQCYITSGVPKFNSFGSVVMTVVGQQVVWEMPYFALGHTALANSALTLSGVNTGNLSYEFQYNLGAGYNGTWLTANATNFTGVGAINPATGIKVKLRATCVTANASNELTNIRIATVTTSTAQSTNLYPLSYAPISVSGLTTGSRVKFSKVSDGSILYSAQEVSGVVNFDNNEYVGAVTIEARNASSAPYYLPWVTQVVTVDGQTTTAIALQQLD